MRMYDWMFAAVLVLVLSAFNLNPAFGMPEVFPDGGNLTYSTFVSKADGQIRFAFSKNVETKWGDSASGRLKKRVLAELLAYRKLTIESLLIQREQIVFLSDRLGLALRHDDVAPAVLIDALNSSFKKTAFKEFHLAFVSSLMDMAAHRTAPSEETEEWRDVILQAVETVRWDIEWRRSQETTADAWHALSVGDEEDDAAFCEMPADTLSSSPPLAQALSDPDLIERARQNELFGRLVEGINDGDPSDLRRLLRFPLNFRREFRERLQDEESRAVLDDVLSIRKTRGGEGTVADFIVALALAELRRRGEVHWVLRSKQHPRSQLICSDIWDEAPFAELSAATLRRAAEILRFGILGALESNNRAILYWAQLGQSSLTETLLPGTRSWAKLEDEPSDPDEMIDKLIDLVPYFQSSSLQARLVEDYGLGTPAGSPLAMFLKDLFEQKQMKLRARQDSAEVFGFMSVGVLAAVTVPFFLPSRFLILLYATSDALYTAFSTLPMHRYRRDILDTATALFFNVDPELPFEIDLQEIDDLIILDKQASLHVSLAAWSLGIAGAWAVGPPAIRQSARLIRMLARSFKGSTSTGHAVMRTQPFYAFQAELMKFFSAVQDEFPELFRVLEERSKQYKHVMAYLPNDEMKQIFPGLWKKTLDAKSWTEDTIPPGTQIWREALNLNLIREGIDASLYTQKIKSAGAASRALRARSILSDILPPKQTRAIHNRLKFTKKWGWQDPETDKIYKHWENVTQAAQQMDVLLSGVEFDFKKSRGVQRLVAAIVAASNTETSIGRGLAGMIRYLKNGKQFSSHIPLGAVPDGPVADYAGAVLARHGLAKVWDASRRAVKSTVHTLQKVWVGDFKLARSDKAFNDLINRLKDEGRLGATWEVHRRTFTEWVHQGLVLGVPSSVVGDRFVRQVIRGRDWSDDWNETMINITVGLAQSLAWNTIAVANLSIRQRVRFTMATSWFTTLLVSMGNNAVRLAVESPGNFLTTLFSPECISAILQRVHFAALFHSTLSAGRSHGVMTLRHALRHPDIGLRQGYRTNNLIFVITMADKTGAGQVPWTYLQGKPWGVPVDAEGICRKEEDPFDFFTGAFPQAAAEATAFSQSMAEYVGFDVPRSAQDYMSIAEALAGLDEGDFDD